MKNEGRKKLYNEENNGKTNIYSMETLR